MPRIRCTLLDTAKRRAIAAPQQPMHAYGSGEYMSWRAALSKALLAAADEIDRLRGDLPEPGGQLRLAIEEDRRHADA